MNSQAFRAKSSSKTITIPTRQDPRSGQRIVRWKDIQQLFEDAKYVMNGDDAVLFLTDDNLEDLIPLRIAYHPGIVLDVIFTDNTEGFTGGLEVLGPRSDQSVVLSRYTPVPNTSQFVGDDHSPRLLIGTEGGIDQEERFKQLQQQAQQIQRQMEEVAQKLSNSEQLNQETQRQMEGMLQKFSDFEQQTQQSIHHSEQQTRQLQQHILSLDQTNEGFSKKQLETLNRHILINNQLDIIFETCFDESSIPRLFIVLPKNPNLDPQEIASCRFFRIHFLCECRSSTIAKDPKGSHRVHLTNHPGYDIKKPKEFFDKYSQYVLTMMHMAKYGAMASGFVVPPLTRTSVMARIGQDYKDIRVSKSNIEQQIDTMITYLGEMSRTADNDIHASQHSTLRNTNLEELKSYLEISEGALFPSDLYQISAQQSSLFKLFQPRRLDHSWVCIEHQHRRVIQRLKDVAGKESYNDNPGKIDIKMESKNTNERLLNAIIDFTKLQWTNDKPSLTMDCGRFSLMVKVSVDLQAVIMTIKNLNGLDKGDIDFIQRCNLTRLEIENTPKTEDEERLTEILQCPKLKGLHIKCVAERSLAIINLVISVREKKLQDGESTGLRTLQVADAEMGLFDLDRSMDIDTDRDHVTTTLTFPEGSAKFDMDTCMILRSPKFLAEGPWISNFLRQYGWSISSLNADWRLPDHLAVHLDNSTQIHGSHLAHLVFSPYSLTTAGLDAMDRVIKRSQSLVFTALDLDWLHEGSQQKKIVPLLRRHGASLNLIRLAGNLSMIKLAGNPMDRWLPQVADNFPTRRSFPALEKLVVHFHSRQQFPQECVQWLVDMVSISPQALLWTGASRQAESLTATSPLAKLQLSRTNFSKREWERIIKAIDLSVLVELKIQKTNFSQEQLDLLLERITQVDTKPLPLEKLDLTDTDLLAVASKSSLRARILDVAPRVTVYGLEY
ncbi:hypothetical protein B0O80DRAFT_424233 [Mortierella sp. GBAus27b]|nr:hypothetical protein BGX31_007601 [Mortierella sp. GBA43]KAI8358149.1 hypothetical protein B0O80DRAFT_424233 [Mortierella sp. GBAus27b]